MKLRFRHLAVYAAASSSILLASCSSLFGGGSDGGSSNITGWGYNSEEWGGFEYKNDFEQETGPGLVFIEGGTFLMGRVEQDVLYGWDATPRRVTVASFYIDECEISNANYREWLYWISRIYSEYPDQYRSALPDTLVWRRPLAYNEPYVENYLRHPAYSDYPVVGVSWIQASNFCKWRTDRVNEFILYRDEILEQNIADQQGENSFDSEAFLYGQYEGIDGEKHLQDPFGNDRRVQAQDGLLLPSYRLPTEAEWEYAALGLIGNTEDERLADRKLYPWNGHVVRNADDSDRGKMMANFVRGNGDYMGTAGSLNDEGDITVNVKSYWPNDYGLYCMAGNVNEWVADVYRPLSFDDVDEFNPFRGNNFQTKILDDTGAPVEKDSLGRIKYRQETDKDILDRKNYRTADNRNYLDGDARSNQILGTDWNDAQDAQGNKPNSTTMYGGTPTQDNLHSLVSDRTRVYKGGGWRDRAYWLSPGTRRFLDERESRDDIGFRCAMTRVGGPSQKSK